jgi:hypothetical protein
LSEGKTTFSALTAAHFDKMLQANACDFEGTMVYDDKKLLAVSTNLKESLFDQIDISLEAGAIQVKPNQKYC